METLSLRAEPREGARSRRFLWGSKAFFAVLDQGLFAGSNFLANVLLARWLPPESYGAFTIAYSVLLLAGTVHTELLTAPLLVFGAGKYSEQFHEYVGVLLQGHLALTIVMSVLMALAAMLFWFLGSTSLAHALLGVAFAAPLVFLLWLARSAFYVRFQPEVAAAGGGLYLLLVLAGFYGLFHAHRLSVMSALGVLGGASLGVGAFLLVRLKPAWPRGSLAAIARSPKTVLNGRRSHRSVTQEVRQVGGGQDQWSLAEVVHDHARYARWSLAASIASWIGGNAHYFVLSSAAGLGAAAVMRILDTALLPFYHYQAALSRVFVPVLGARLRDPDGDLWSYILRMAAWWAAQACVMYLLLRLFAVRLLPWFYGQAYAGHSALLGWYGLTLIPGAVVAVVLSLFRVSVRTDLTFQYHIVFSLALLAAFLMVAQHGLIGIIMARVVLSALMVPAGLFAARTLCARSSRS